MSDMLNQSISDNSMITLLL